MGEPIQLRTDAPRQDVKRQMVGQLSQVLTNRHVHRRGVKIQQVSQFSGVLTHQDNK